MTMASEIALEFLGLQLQGEASGCSLRDCRMEPVPWQHVSPSQLETTRKAEQTSPKLLNFKRLPRLHIGLFMKNSLTSYLK